MEREFDITMYVPQGRRRGTLRFSEDRGKLRGTLEAFGKKDSLTGTIDENGNLKINGRISSILRTFPYQAMGQIRDSEIELAVVGDRYSFRITGEELHRKSQEEDNQ